MKSAKESCQYSYEERECSRNFVDCMNNYVIEAPMGAFSDINTVRNIESLFSRFDVLEWDSIE